tara:strand:+ start:111 stop:905 length:795 start_codon:yes stop_codon:yes gene_type:complete
MDDDEYFDDLVEKASFDVVTYGWYDCVDGFKQADVDMGNAFHRKLGWMDKMADIYLSDNNKMSGFVGKFAQDCGISYAYAKQLNLTRKVGCNLLNFSSDALKALLSAPKELREDIVSSVEPVTVAEVKKVKEGYKEVQNNPDNSDLKEAVKEKQKTPVEAANEAWERSEEKRKEIEAQPNVFDLGAYVKSTEHCRVDVTARCMVITMEQLVSKFDRRDIMANLHAAIREDVIGVKIPALHAMAEMLTELCEDLPIQETKLRNVT